MTIEIDYSVLEKAIDGQKDVKISQLINDIEVLKQENERLENENRCFRMIYYDTKIKEFEW